MIVKLLTEYHLGLVSLKGGCTGSFETTLVKMPHCWKSHVTTQMIQMILTTVVYSSASPWYGDTINAVTSACCSYCSTLTSDSPPSSSTHLETIISKHVKLINTGAATSAYTFRHKHEFRTFPTNTSGKPSSMPCIRVEK